MGLLCSFSNIRRRKPGYALILATVSLVLSGSANRANSSVVKSISNAPVDIVIVAHADDWQVFLGDVVVDRLRDGRRGVFIYLTAGDHGRDSVYWRRRETAALQSTRVALGISPRVIAHCDTLMVSVHPVLRCQLGSSDSFFFRLPDGNRNGHGFARNGFESLRKLRSGGGAMLHALDSSTTYTSWQDLVTTLSALVRMVADSSNETQMVLHTTDPSVRRNPHDHYDHRIAGKLTERLLETDRWNGRYYIGYALVTRAPNRTAAQRQEKLEVFSAYDHEMMRINPSWSAYREHPAFYTECMQRTYARPAGAQVARSDK